MLFNPNKFRFLTIANKTSRLKKKVFHSSNSELPDGLLTDSLNHFRRAHKDSFREIYISSQAAAPLCQANVESAKAVMRSLIEQAAYGYHAQAQRLGDEAAALLTQVELTPEQVEALRVEREVRPENSPSLSEGASAKTMPESQSAPAKRRGRPRKQLAQPPKTGKPDDDLRYDESAPIEIGRKKSGGTR